MAQAVVGLGNPGPEYRNTRHNVGQRVVDLLARALHKRPTREGTALVARGEWQGETLYLVKPLAFMNASGPPVARVAARLGLSPAELILAYDDIDLALGIVRVRMKGSHGGHKGVRSIMEALGTDELRRVVAARAVGGPRGAVPRTGPAALSERRRRRAGGRLPDPPLHGI